MKSFNDNEFLKYKHHNNQLTLTSTVLARCYGLPKIHKKDIPLRPIISLINSPTYFLAKILYEVLKDNLNTPISHINNSFELKEKIKDIIIDDDHILISLDVSSLFTNIPSKLVLESLDKRCLLIHQNCKIPFKEIANCSKFLFENTLFSFNGNVYQQIEGTPMGSPISPLFADIVMDNLEVYCLHKLKINHNCSPLFYYRYVDDTILCVHKKHVDLIINTFNSYSSNLQFTFELEHNKRINFLDMTLIRHQNCIITDSFQKPSSSGRMINYLSNHPIQHKKNIVYNLVDKALLLSEKMSHNKNPVKVKSLLTKNNYPINFIENNVKRRMSKIKYYFLDNNNNNNKKIVSQAIFTDKLQKFIFHS